MKKHNKYQFQKEKKKNWLITIMLTVIGLLLTGVVVWVGMNDWDVEKSMEKAGISSVFLKEEDKKDEGRPIENDVKDGQEPELKPAPEPKPTPPAIVPNKEDNVAGDDELPKDEYIEGQELPKSPTVKNGIVIANKHYPLPKDYKPGESEKARSSFEEMAAEALLFDINLTAFSTYRSYEYQVGLYERYVERDGIAKADRYSARPGYSEHQTGLAFDIGEVGKTNDFASKRFGDSEAAKWLVSNAHRYGFILRYPEGKEEITGYMHESWHYRYVGKNIAEKIYNDNLTLEEYLEL